MSNEWEPIEKALADGTHYALRVPSMISHMDLPGPYALRADGVWIKADTKIPVTRKPTHCRRFDPALEQGGAAAIKKTTVPELIAMDAIPCFGEMPKWQRPSMLFSCTTREDLHGFVPLALHYSLITRELTFGEKRRGGLAPWTSIQALSRGQPWLLVERGGELYVDSIGDDARCRDRGLDPDMPLVREISLPRNVEYSFKVYLGPRSRELDRAADQVRFSATIDSPAPRRALRP